MAKTQAEKGTVHATKSSIRDMVARGELVPGQRLVEPDMATRFSISRASLREAFSALEAEGLLKVERYKGASVRRVDARAVREAFEIRELLEGLAARRAAPRFAVPAPRTRLVRLFDAMEVCSSTAKGLGEYFWLNQQFHELIRETAASEELNAMVQYIQPPLIVRLVYQQLAHAETAPRSVEEHRPIYEAFMVGDAVRAEAAMRKHIRSSMKALLQLLEEGKGTGN
jgi:DNA-binding GntR family transcriptional regulator